MSKTPFLDFLKKLSTDHKLSEKYYEQVIAVFKGTGLSNAQVQALVSGDRVVMATLLELEFCQVGRAMAGPHLPWPLSSWGS